MHICEVGAILVISRPDGSISREYCVITKQLYYTCSFPEDGQVSESSECKAKGKPHT